MPFSACTYIYVGKSAGAKHPNVLHRISVALQVAVYGYLQWCTAELSRKNMFFVSHTVVCAYMLDSYPPHIYSLNARVFKKYMHSQGKLHLSLN